MLSRIWNRRRPTRPGTAPRARLGLENLEDRAVPAAPSFDVQALAGLEGQALLSSLTRAADTNVYVETNDPAAGQNAVLAFHRNPVNGDLRQFGKFNTGGTGQLNLPKVIGPDDGDKQVVASPDGRFLYAVNQGSDSITAFRIRGDGSLSRVGTFDSGGVQPDSIGIADGRLYVANRGDADAGHTGTVAPNVTGFDVGRDGSLSPIPNSTVTFPVDTFATQVLVSRNGRLLFAQLASLSGAPEGNSVVPYQVRSDGTLELAPGGSAAASDNPPIQLGLAFNPHLNVIYAGLTGARQVGVYTYDETGRTSFVGSAPDQGAAPCWCVVSSDGRTLYVATTGTDSVGVYSLADPLHPVQIQEFALRGPRLGPDGTTQTADFEIALDPSGRSLYVVNQSTSPTGTFAQGNQLHVLSVARDGTVSEPIAPILFSPRDVPANAHPQGIAVVGGPALGGRDDSFFAALAALLSQHH
jgi:hypothetical protein